MPTDFLQNELETLTGFLYVIPVGLIQFGANGGIHLANPLAVQCLMPLSPNSDMADAYSALYPIIPDLASRIREFQPTAGIIVDHLRCEVHAGGRDIVLSITVHRVNADNYLAVLDDVTQLVQQERKIFEDQQRLRAIFDNVRDYAIYTIDDAGHVEGWNPSLERFGRWRPDDVVNRTLADFHLDLQDVPDALNELLRRARQAGSAETEGWWLQRDGQRIWSNTVLTAMPNKDGQVRGFVVVTRDMTERKRMEDELRRLASTDPLTGALNRRAGRELLKAAFANERTVDAAPGAILVDIDFFKHINDKFGHDAGDVALTEVVRICNGVTGSAKPIVRWGGEEFVIVLSETSVAAAQSLAEELRQAVASAVINTPAGEMTMTISVGVAVGRSTPDALIHDADVALYKAKTSGRNRVEVA